MCTLPLAKASDVVEVVDARGGEGDGGCLGEVASQISLPGLDMRGRHQVRLWGRGVWCYRGAMACMAVCV